MTFASLAQPFQNQALSTPVRYLAGIIGAFLVAAFLHEAVRHPAEGWLGAILCGLPMIWLIQRARTGSTQNWESIVWYAVWYAVFASSWVVARAYPRLSITDLGLYQGGTLEGGVPPGSPS